MKTGRSHPFPALREASVRVGSCELPPPPQRCLLLAESRGARLGQAGPGRAWEEEGTEHRPRPWRKELG